MRITSRAAYLRTWLLFNGVWLGFPILGLGLGAIVVFLAIPTGPTREADGWVVGYHYVSARRGTALVADVALPDGRMVMPRGAEACGVGHRLRVRVTPKLWGLDAQVASLYPCRPHP